MTWFPELPESATPDAPCFPGGRDRNSEDCHARDVRLHQPWVAGMSRPTDAKIVIDVSNGSTATSHIVVMNTGMAATHEGLGGRVALASFNEDGSRLVMTHSGNGIVTMKSRWDRPSSSDRPVGLGNLQWSPDGKSIAYGKFGNIMIFDVATGQSRPLFTGDSAMRYTSTRWNLGWSHDSQIRFVSKGNRRWHERHGTRGRRCELGE